MDNSDSDRSPTSFLVWGCVAVAAIAGFFLFRQFTADDSLPGTVDYDASEELASALFEDDDVVDGVRVASGSADEALTLTETAGTEQVGVVFSTGEDALGDSASEAAPGRGDAYDVTTVNVTVEVPADATCMVIPELQFGSDEANETADGFVIEVGESTWSLENQSVTDTGISVDAASGLLTEETSFGTVTVARATPVVEARISIEPGSNEVFFSIFDAQNSSGTSVGVLGGIRFDDSSNCGDRMVVAEQSNLVALGDSYASGFGLPPFEAGTSETEGNNCQRSTTSYPEILAEAGGFDLESRACQGARTIDLYEEFDARGEEPQLEALRPDTGVVVLTIGGNDTDWADVLSACVVESFLGPACNENVEANTQFESVFDRLAGDADEPAEVKPYDEILDDIRKRAPFAEIVVVSYPPLFAEGGVGTSDLDRCSGVLKADQQWINEQLGQASVLLVEAAEEFDAVVVDLVDEFDGHGLCEQDPWFMDLSGDGPLHPNANGHEAIADAVQQQLEALNA